MTYIRDPRTPNCWESDGEAPFGKYRAADGKVFDSPHDADRHDKERGNWPWKAEPQQEGSKP